MVEDRCVRSKSPPIVVPTPGVGDLDPSPSCDVDRHGGTPSAGDSR